MAAFGSTNFELVGDFMESMDQDIHLDPEFPEEHIQRLRINLIEEELDELFAMTICATCPELSAKTTLFMAP